MPVGLLNKTEELNYFQLKLLRKLTVICSSYKLTIPLCGRSNVQRPETQCWLCFSVGYYSTWLWIRTPLLSCGSILQGLCRSLIFSLHTGGEILWQLFFNHSTVFTEGYDWTNVGHPVCLLKGILIDSNLPASQVCERYYKRGRCTKWVPETPPQLHIFGFGRSKRPWHTLAYIGDLVGKYMSM